MGRVAADPTSACVLAAATPTRRSPTSVPTAADTMKGVNTVTVSLPAATRVRQKTSEHFKVPPGSDALPQKKDLGRAVPAAPHRRRSGRSGGPGRAQRGGTSVQRGRLAPAHRHFGSATSRTRTNDATRAHTDTEDHAAEHPPTRPLTRGVPKRRRSESRSFCGYRRLPGRADPR